MPRPEDVPLLDDLFDALHNPSLVEAGEKAIPQGLEQRYQELRFLTDWEQSARLDFDPAMATSQYYFYREWKPPEGMFPTVQGQLVRNPSFRLPRNQATYREMREPGFEPLSWNPYEQWKTSRLQGMKYRQQMELVEYLKGLGDELIKPHSGGPIPPGWRVPEVGPAFEGKPFVFNDPNTGEAVQGFTSRWISRDEIANVLENGYGKRPSLGTVVAGGRSFDPIKLIDWLTFVPKRFKLVGPFLQQVDFLMRGGSGSWASTVNALRTGHPVQAVRHMASFPPTAADIVGSFFVPRWREGIVRKLDDVTPLVKDRPGVNIKSVSESGLNIYDPTAFGRNPLDLDGIIREVIQEGRAKKAFLATPRAFKELERVTRQGLFGGVYPAAIINDVQHNLGPQMIRTYGKTLNDAQLSRAIAQAANMRYSSLPANQSVVQNRVLREMLIRVMFSLNENEGLLRQATNALPFGLRFNKHFIPVPTRGGHFQKFWVDHWLGTYAFLIATANLIHFASTGPPLPKERYSPISSNKWGPLPFGYNTQFASPDISFAKPFGLEVSGSPLIGRGGTRILLDLVGQMDTVFRILNPAQFAESRTSVPIGAFRTQKEAEDFYGDPIDEIGPGGVVSRTTHFAQDMFLPIGPGQAGVSILPQEVPGVQPFAAAGEEKIGIPGQLIQAIGLNVRGETIDQGLKRRYPNYDCLPPKTKNLLRDELILPVFGPRT